MTDCIIYPDTWEVTFTTPLDGVGLAFFANLMPKQEFADFLRSLLGVDGRRLH